MEWNVARKRRVEGRSVVQSEYAGELPRACVNVRECNEIMKGVERSGIRSV